jgi:hypothetical protein
MNFQEFSEEVDDRFQLESFFRGIDMEFSKTKELAALIPVKGTAAGPDVYEDVNMMMQCLTVPIRIVAGAVTDKARSIPGRKSDVSLPSYVKDKMGHNLMIFHCLMHEENLCAQSFKVMNLVALFSNFVKE